METTTSEVFYLKAPLLFNTYTLLLATVQRLSHMVTVTLTLVCFMLIILAIVLSIQLYRWKKKKNITFDTIKNKIFAKVRLLRSKEKLILTYF
jgi:hypothetical protein